MNQNIAYACPPCHTPSQANVRKSRAAQDLINRHKQNLSDDLSYLEMQRRALVWLEYRYPLDDDAWCGLTTRQLAKRWGVGIGTVSRWRRTWECEGRIITTRRGRKMFMRSGPKISEGLL